MTPPNARHIHRRVLVWSLMLIAGILSFTLFYAQFHATSVALLQRPYHIAAMVSSAIFAALIAWGVGVLLTGINAVFTPSNRRESPLIPVEPAPDHAGPQRFTLARCPRCDYQRRGLAIDAPCPECGESPPRVHTLPGSGRAMALYGVCTHCGRALRKNARFCAGCRYPVPRASNRPGNTPAPPDSP